MILRAFIVVVVLCLAVPVAVLAGQGPCAHPDPWLEIQRKAEGQTVYFNAWAGDANTNNFLAWVAEQVADMGVTLRHVKVGLTSEVVSRVVAEKAAGNTQEGSVDLVWINGENFLAMKEQGLLYGPFTGCLPNFGLVDTEGKPTTVRDFTVPVEGYESPWRMAQLVFIHDAERLPEPPRSMRAMLAWAKDNPGRLTHPQIRNFLGSTFLKQALYAFAPDPKVLQTPATDTSYAATTAAMWAWYDRLKPHLWRGGEQFPDNAQAMHQLLADAEIDISFSFHPAEASAYIASGFLPETVRTFVLKGGTIGNTSFVAIPFNAAHKEGAMVVADFLLSPRAQYEMAKPEVLGETTVLDREKLTPAWRQQFAEAPRGPATLDAASLGAPLDEPHPSWMNRIVDDWLSRYGG